MASARSVECKSGVASTVDSATAAICATDLIPDSSSVLIEYHLVGKTALGALVANSQGYIAGKRTGGVTAAVGVIVPLITFAAGSDAGIATAVPIINVTANTFRLQVTGVAGNTIEWFGDLRVWLN